MADDKSNTGPQDSSRVNTSEDYEVAYWTQAFECTPDELQAAIDKVGPMADDVRAEIRRKRG